MRCRSKACIEHWHGKSDQLVVIDALAGGRAMTSREDLLDRAAQCERLKTGEPDNVRKIVFGLIRDIWIALANERASMSPKELAQEVAAIARIQRGFQDGPS